MDSISFRTQILKRYDEEFTQTLTESPMNYGDDNPKPEFISTLTRAFEEEVTFRFSEFNVYSTEILIDYVKRTHNLYLKKTLNEIEQSLSILNEAYQPGHSLLEILNDFYLDYKHELSSHIRTEEEKLIPYIQYLETARKEGFDMYEFYSKSRAFDISEFFENHEENDTSLEKIREQILLYEPPPVNRFIYGVLLNQLEIFEQDLRIHGLLEEQVLIPRALENEKKLMARFLKTAVLN